MICYDRTCKRLGEQLICRTSSRVRKLVGLGVNFQVLHGTRMTAETDGTDKQGENKVKGDSADVVNRPGMQTAASIG